MRELQKLSESNEPHIICGDFNSWRGSAPYQLLLDGHLNEENLTALQAIEVVVQPDGQVELCTRSSTNFPSLPLQRVKGEVKWCGTSV